MVRDDLEASGYRSLLPAGVVVTGGTAQLPGLAEMAAQVFEMPVRIGFPGELEGLVDTISNPAFATGVGLVRWSYTHGSGGEGVYEDRRPITPNSDISGRLKGWLKAFLP